MPMTRTDLDKKGSDTPLPQDCCTAVICVSSMPPMRTALLLALASVAAATIECTACDSYDADCGCLVLVPSNECPVRRTSAFGGNGRGSGTGGGSGRGDGSGPGLDTVANDCRHIEIGALCEADGECHTNDDANNCDVSTRGSSTYGRDIYRRVECQTTLPLPPPPPPLPDCEQFYCAAGASCGICLQPIASGDCPAAWKSDWRLHTCDRVDVGELCEADGECGTTEINNCAGRDFDWGPGRRLTSSSSTTTAADVYRRVACLYPAPPPSPPALPCERCDAGLDCGVCLQRVEADECPRPWRTDFELPTCDVALKGELCEGDGECSTSTTLNNCHGSDGERDPPPMPYPPGGAPPPPNPYPPGMAPPKRYPPPPSPCPPGMMYVRPPPPSPLPPGGVWPPPSPRPPDYRPKPPPPWPYPPGMGRPPPPTPCPPGQQYHRPPPPTPCPPGQQYLKPPPPYPSPPNPRPPPPFPYPPNAKPKRAGTPFWMRQNADVYRVIDCVLPGDEPIDYGVGGGVVFLLMLFACIGGAVSFKLEQKFGCCAKLATKCANRVGFKGLPGWMQRRARPSPTVNNLSINTISPLGGIRTTTTNKMSTPLTSDVAPIGIGSMQQSMPSESL